MRKGRKVFHLTEEEAEIIQEIRLSRRTVKTYPSCVHRYGDHQCLTQAKDPSKRGLCGHHWNMMKRYETAGRNLEEFYAKTNDH